ncbi:MAG TPA: replication-associated recombination protein A [Longimicrobiaceae bacterium]|nr:replication-associated recombination protein A [Longimicrobiaceae bacterium]
MSDDTLPLFPDAPYEAGGTAPPPFVAEAPSRGAGDAPLPERMRPRSLDELVGQEALVGEGGTLRKLLRGGRIPSLILHGPPGSGKTTLGRLLAERLGADFVPFSAVSEGVPRLREIVKEAERARKAGRRTLLFVDEIHRLNKGQQDFLLPYVESGLVTLVGATTEHPAFEVNAALLSRARVVVLGALGEEELRTLLRRAVADAERGLGASGVTLSPEAEALLIRAAGGDARQALGTLEVAAQLAGAGGRIGEEAAREAVQHRVAHHDTSTSFQLLSAFHKSLRSSQGDAALYWAARMIRAGEDPRVLLRRLVAAAYEDVGLADPQAGVVATQAMQAYERLGPPEGLLPLANAILYVASAPKSNRAYRALQAATEAAERAPDAPVPLHLRNASTRLMKEWGYGKGYQYAHDFEGARVDMNCLPDELQDARFYEPSDHGFEREIAERMRERGTRP